MATQPKQVSSDKPCSPFMAHALRAVSAEKKGDFGKAAEVWGEACLLSGIAVNREWAGTRIEFCSNAAKRGWGVVGESEGV